MALKLDYTRKLVNLCKCICFKVTSIYWNCIFYSLLVSRYHDEYLNIQDCFGNENEFFFHIMDVMGILLNPEGLGAWGPFHVIEHPYILLLLVQNSHYAIDNNGYLNHPLQYLIPPWLSEILENRHTWLWEFPLPLCRGELQ